MRQDATVGEVAQRVGLSVGSAHYRVRQLLSHDLIEVTREERRAGRTLKIYRARARQYFIPFGVTDSEDAESFWWSFTQPLYEQFVRAMMRNFRHHVPDMDAWGLLIGPDAVGGLELRCSPAPGGAVRKPSTTTALSTLNWESLSLSHAQAQSMMSEIRAVVERYRALSGPHAYLWQAGLTVEPPAPEKAPQTKRRTPS